MDITAETILAMFGLMLILTGFAGGVLLTLCCYLVDKVKYLHDKKQENK